MRHFKRNVMSCLSLSFGLLLASSVLGFSCPSVQKNQVTAIYRQALSRDPDIEGLNHWCKALLNGNSAKSVFSSVVKSSEYEQKFVSGRSKRIVVENLYKTILARCPDQGGLLNWVGEIRRNGGRHSYAFVVEAFFRSTEYNTRFGLNDVPHPKPNSCSSFSCPHTQKDQVTKMYQQALNRHPDTGGLNDRCVSLLTGDSVKSLFPQIVKSAEYKQKFVNGRSLFFVVVNLHKTVLSRCPDKGGLLNWVEQLEKRGGIDSYGSVTDSFFASREYQNKFGSDTVPFPKPQGICPGKPPGV